MVEEEEDQVEIQMPLLLLELVGQVVEELQEKILLQEQQEQLTQVEEVEEVIQQQPAVRESLS
jgi:hypothetical protein